LIAPQPATFFFGASSHASAMMVSSLSDQTSDDGAKDVKEEENEDGENQRGQARNGTVSHVAGGVPEFVEAQSHENFQGALRAVRSIVLACDDAPKKKVAV
jgi:hypothetical protein